MNHNSKGRDPTYPKRVPKRRRELESRVLPLLKLLDEYQNFLPMEKLYSLTSLLFLTLKCVWGEFILAQARKSRPFKNSYLILSIKRGILAQARISQSQQPQNVISRPGEPTLAQVRILQYSPGFHPPKGHTVFGVKNFFYPSLIREFYANFQNKNGEYLSLLKWKLIVLNDELFLAVGGLPSSVAPLGDCNNNKCSDFDSTEMYKSCLRGSHYFLLEN
ncbi:hypothetical protein Lal_00022103 [Lupinus albus]|nr:hypothetical protein Lal_00022103 [Lupinus albus]